MKDHVYSLSLSGMLLAVGALVYSLSIPGAVLITAGLVSGAILTNGFFANSLGIRFKPSTFWLGLVGGVGISLGVLQTANNKTLSMNYGNENYIRSAWLLQDGDNRGRRIFTKTRDASIVDLRKEFYIVRANVNLNSLVSASDKGKQRDFDKNMFHNRCKLI